MTGARWDVPSWRDVLVDYFLLGPVTYGVPVSYLLSEGFIVIMLAELVGRGRAAVVTAVGGTPGKDY